MTEGQIIIYLNELLVFSSFKGSPWIYSECAWSEYENEDMYDMCIDMCI